MQFQTQERPPFVIFELRAVEDRQASIKAGHAVYSDVPFALVTPMGSKDQVEFIAEDWLKMLSDEVRNGRFPRTWLEGFKASFKGWQEGVEVPPNGTAIRNWPPATPAEVKMLQDLKILTVEDLANANESLLTAIGIGGRQLRERARAWLTVAAAGAPAEELSAMREELSAKDARIQELSAQVKELSEAMEKLQPKGTKPL